jgi:hypothetical protein
MANFDIGEQQAETIIQGDEIHLHNATAEVDYFGLGLKALRAKNYSVAIKHLSAAVDLAAEDPDVNYFLALALLQGVRPRMHSEQSIERVRRHLMLAGSLPHAVMLLALLEDDHGLLWRTRPALTPLHLQRAQAVRPELALEITEHIDARQSPVWQALHLRA